MYVPQRNGRRFRNSHPMHTIADLCEDIHNFCTIHKQQINMLQGACNRLSMACRECALVSQLAWRQHFLLLPLEKNVFVTGNRILKRALLLCRVGLWGRNRRAKGAELKHNHSSLPLFIMHWHRSNRTESKTINKQNKME